MFWRRNLLGIAVCTPMHLASAAKSVSWHLVLHCGETDMSSGTVKWFNPQKGYGFIEPDGGGRDVFVHISAVEAAGLATLGEGQRVNFEIGEDRPGKTAAKNLSLAD